MHAYNIKYNLTLYQYIRINTNIFVKNNNSQVQSYYPIIQLSLFFLKDSCTYKIPPPTLNPILIITNP